MGHGYEPEFGGGKARDRLILAVVGLSGGILLTRPPHSFPALKICPQCFRQPLLALLGGSGSFWQVFRRIPRHTRLSNTSSSHWEGFPLCGRLRFGGMLP
jgi:hypothetical protein